MKRYLAAAVLLANSNPVNITWLNKKPHTQSANFPISNFMAFCIKDSIAGYGIECLSQRCLNFALILVIVNILINISHYLQFYFNNYNIPFSLVR